MTPYYQEPRPARHISTREQIELPGSIVSKAKIYQIETVPGNVGNPPVRLSFQDMNADGKLDMLVQIGDGSATLYVTLFNNGTGFVSKL